MDRTSADRGPGTPALIAAALLLSACFAIAYGQQPLYSDNQNAHLLRGLAAAGYGNLHEDWLAHTADPFPPFSAIVGFTWKWMGENFFYLWQALLQGLYILCFVGIGAEVAGIGRRPGPLAGFAVAALTLHSRLFDDLTMALLGVDLGRIAHHGVALQYAIDRTFQPSAFSVLLLLSLWLFLRRKDVWAAIALGAGVALYFSIAAGGAVLAGSYLAVIALREQKWGRAAGLGLLMLLLVLPTTVYVWQTFTPTDPVQHAEAQRLMFAVRIPHHADPADWGNNAFGKLAWVLFAAWLARRSRLAPVLFIGAAAVTAAALYVFLSRDMTVALLFPWRLSVILMPAATAVALALLMRWLGGRIPKTLESAEWLPGTAASVLVITLVLYGGWRMSDDFAAHAARPEAGVQAYIRTHKQPGDLYVVPLGSEDFRLATGAAVYVDYKSHPYDDAGILKWWRRVALVRKLESGSAISSEQTGIQTVGNFNYWIIFTQTESKNKMLRQQNIRWQDSKYAIIGYH